MSDSIIDREKQVNKKRTYAYVIIGAGLLILFSSLIFLGNNIIVTIVGIIIAAYGYSYFRKI